MNITPQIHIHSFKKTVPFPMQQLGANLMLFHESEFHTAMSLNIGLIDWILSVGVVFCTHPGKDSSGPLIPKT